MVWEKLMLDDALARQPNPTQPNPVCRYHNDLYWGMSDALDELKRHRADFIAGYDPRTGFKVVKNEAFDDDDAVGIHIQLRKPNGHKEDVVLGNLSTSPSSANSFGLQAKDSEGTDGAALTLLVKQH